MKQTIIDIVIDYGAPLSIFLSLGLLCLVVAFAGWLRAGESATAQRLRDR